MFEVFVSYDEFMTILGVAQEDKLCNAPAPDDINNLAPGVYVMLALEEMGCNGYKKGEVYHHRVRATPLFEELSAYYVDIPDSVWREIPAVEKWAARIPLVTARGPEDGDETGVREPRPEPKPTDDTGASVPLEAPVG